MLLNVFYNHLFSSADCTDKTYGVNCKETCGHCKDQSTCAVTDGRCPTGCETWYISDVCKTLIGMHKIIIHNGRLYSWQVDVTQLFTWMSTVRRNC